MSAVASQRESQLEPLASIDESRVILGGNSEASFYRLVARGQLPVVKVGARSMIERRRPSRVTASPAEEVVSFPSETMTAEIAGMPHTTRHDSRSAAFAFRERLRRDPHQKRDRGARHNRAFGSHGL